MSKYQNYVSRQKQPPYCKFCRGQVWWEKDVPFTGNIQSSDRPVLIISDDIMNSVSNNVIVLPMTTRHKFDSESNYVLPFNERSSVVLGDQPRTVPKDNLKNYMYTVSPDVLESAVKSILVAIGVAPRTKPIHRLQITEELQSVIKPMPTKPIPENAQFTESAVIINEYLNNGIQGVEKFYKCSTSTAYKRLNEVINTCKKEHVLDDLIKKVEEKRKIGKITSTIKSVEIIKEQPKLSRLDILTDCEGIKKQIIALIDNRGEYVQRLRTFKTHGTFIHPGTNQPLDGMDKYRYLSALYEIVTADKKLSKDIKKINTSLKFKIANLLKESDG